jgi:hypothetical protein
MTSRKAVAALVAFTLVTGPILQAVDSKKAAYHGGTISTFTGAKEPVEGRLDTGNTDALILTAEDKPFVGATLRIPYTQIIDLEYGQKAGRRVGAALGTALINPVGLFLLFSKKRKHYLTIGYKDESGTDQVAVLELGKDIVRTTLPIIETRSGKTIEYQDDEARKASRGSN